MLVSKQSVLMFYQLADKFWSIGGEWCCAFLSRWVFNGIDQWRHEWWQRLLLLLAFQFHLVPVCSNDLVKIAKCLLPLGREYTSKRFTIFFVLRQNNHNQLVIEHRCQTNSLQCPQFCLLKCLKRKVVHKLN